MTAYVLDLKDIRGQNPRQVGGKAVNLGELSINGVNVPDGFTVTTEAYQRFIAYNDLFGKEAEDIQRGILDSSFPDEVKQEISIHYQKFKDSPVAVRSSATEEDLPEASFAGQMETYLNTLTFEAVLSNIRKCYASLWSERAVSYREENRFSHRDTSIAVIIQLMVKPVKAGVMFTCDPVTGGNNLLIESNYGLGDSVVSGESTPDRFMVGRDGNILSTDVGSKILITVPDPAGGVITRPPTQEEVQNPSLNSEEIRHLTALGLNVETQFRSPQDIEWAIDEKGDILLLQSRPVTTTSTQSPETVWTRGYSDDYWNDTVSPLFFDLMGEHISYYVNIELNELLGYTKKGETTDLLKLHKAHVYFNLDVLKIKVENEIPEFLRNDDVLNYFPEKDPEYGKDVMKELEFKLLGRITAELRVMTKDPDGSASKTFKAYEKWVKEEFKPFWCTFRAKLGLLESEPVSNYLQLADELDEVIIKHFRLVRYGLPTHNIGMNLLTQYLLRRFTDEQEALQSYPILVSGLKHRTSETNTQLLGLVNLIRRDPWLSETVTKIPSEELYSKLAATEQASWFMTELDAFLHEYGCRGFTREPFYPRWGEAPEYVFDILKTLLESESLNLSHIEERNNSLRNETEEKVRKLIKNQNLGSIKYGLFSYVLETARTYIVFRELQRFNLDRWITMNRDLYLAIGRRLHHEGFLASPDDVFFLMKKEVYDIIKGKDIKPPIQERRSEFNLYEGVTPPKFIKGRTEFDDPAKPHSDTIHGIPASQGIRTGSIRVLTDIRDITLVKAGDILVVPRTDPGWTPVFSKIGGLITETGGILSHGAVVSREYGVPAVTNIPGACELFRTGQTVTINGATGTVDVDKDGEINA